MRFLFRSGACFCGCDSISSPPATETRALDTDLPGLATRAADTDLLLTSAAQKWLAKSTLEIALKLKMMNTRLRQRITRQVFDKTSALVQKSSNQGFSRHNPIECNTSPSQHRCKTTLFQAARDLSGTPCLILLFTLSEFPSPTTEGHGPRTRALGASQRFVYRELTERVIIVKTARKKSRKGLRAPTSVRNINAHAPAAPQTTN